MSQRLEIRDWRLPSAVCGPSSSTCTTCSDEVQRATVLRVDGERFMAHADLQGETVDIDVSLVPAVQEGDVLLVHGGVALEKESSNG